MKQTIVLITAAFFLCGPAATARQQEPIAAALDTVFKEHIADGPGGILIVARNGQQLFHKEFGYASVEHRAPVTNETVFEAASVSKQFTATAVLLLVKNGLLTLDDDIHRYIPELPDYGHKINIRQLLTHTSGLKDWRNVSYITSLPNGYRLYTQKDALDLICKQRSLNYIPGDKYSYTNSGFDLLGILVERITKRPFAAFVKDSLLTPAGMTHSAFRNKFMDIIPNKATPYLGARKKYEHGFTLDETYGAAGLLTTADDLRKWNEYINKGGAGTLVQQLRLQRYVLNNGDTISYANGGVWVRNIDGISEISHSGLISGYRALVVYYPGRDISVTYMSNNRNILTTELQTKVFEILFGKKRRAPVPVAHTVAVPVETLNSKTGHYVGVEDPSDYLRFTVNKDQLICYEAPLQPTGTNEFVYETNVYRFSPSADSLTVNRSGEDYKFYKVPAFSPTADELRSFTGLFHSDDCDVNLECKVTGNKLVAYRKAYDSVVLTPAYRQGNLYAFRGFDHGLRAMYIFRKSSKGPVNGLSISLPRAYNIPFTKQKSK